MMVQYLEGLPGLRLDHDATWVETEGDELERELATFYEAFMEIEEDPKAVRGSRFQFGPDTGRTFFTFLETAAHSPFPRRAVKGQIVGPFTLLCGLLDRRRRPLLYDERMRDVVARHLAAKAKWQIEYLKTLGAPVILFVDEPALAGYGSSAYITVSAEMVRGLLAEVFGAIHGAGARAGIHVCANTDWALVMGSSPDIISFDAFSHFDRFALYGKDIDAYLVSGRSIAWGMVPTGDAAAALRESPQSLADRWFDQVQALVSRHLPLERILAQSLFTPSCGCGSLAEGTAETVVRLTHALSESMQKGMAG
jgi:hypothetical protein